MMDLQPINTGDLIGIAQFAVGITQCALIWYGLYTMREGTRQREKALDEIIAQGQEDSNEKRWPEINRSPGGPASKINGSYGVS